MLYFQGLGGASGDMILAALASLGVDLDSVEQAVSRLAGTPIRLRVEPASSHALHGVRVHVEAPEDSPSTRHRSLADILTLIGNGDLPPGVQAQSERVFMRLAEAEADVHNTTPDAIHFHEVGALDSIADIVGCCLGLDRLAVDDVAVAPLPIGCGTVECAHGIYPTPAPATAWLLRDSAVVQTDEPFELVTPTGAALLTTWRSLALVPPGSRLVQIGYGFGHRTLNGRPNVLRAMLFEPPVESEGDSCLVLECHVDDTTPELIGQFTEKALAAGALDVYTTGVQMKKQRPGTLVTILCRLDDREAVLDLLFRETTTFGVRESVSQRTTLKRRMETVETPFGPVRVKVGTWRGDDVTVAPEMDDCIRLASEAGVSTRSVYEAALRPVDHG